MAQQFVYTMKGLGKTVPPKRQILKDIWLSFLPGAKIGVLGNNGSGKSTLMRIMAGIDDDIMGEAKPAKGLRVGYLPQEPQLDPEKTVLGNVEEGVGEIRALLDEFNVLSEKFAEPMSDDEMDSRLQAAFGQNNSRLQKPKAQYDPDNQLQLNQNIVPIKQCASSVSEIK